MSLRTITKIVCVVISATIVANVLSSCSSPPYEGRKQPSIDSAASPFEPPQTIARIKSADIKESSGLAVSRCQEDVFWTHNDSGDGPFIYAFSANGESLGAWRVEGADNIDWEDLALIVANDGNCYLFIGEIGDNDLKREEHIVYKVAEPIITLDSRNRSRENALSTETAESLRFRYPDDRYDSEALLIHPNSGELYVITKSSENNAHIFKLAAVFGEAETSIATKVGEISLPAKPRGLVTGGSISPDGKRVVLCDYYSGYEFELSEEETNFDAIWRSKPSTFDLGPRVIGESISYGFDPDSVFATTEKPNAPLIRVVRKK